MDGDTVFSVAEEFASSHAATPEQHHLLARAFRGRRNQLRRQARAPDDPDCIAVPQWVYRAIRDDAAPILALTVATALLWAGIDLLDDLMDGDLPPEVQGFVPAEVTLAAITLITALAPLALSVVPASPPTIVAMQQTLAQGLLAMSAGQQRDVAMAGSGEVSVAAVEAAVLGKTGAGVAMLAALAAVLAEAPEDRVATYARMGRALGAACQLHSDAFDLFSAPVSRDLRNGTRTLPIAWHLERLSGPKRDRFLALLDRARLDRSAVDAVRAELMEAGTVQACAFTVELYCQEARQALAQAHAREPAAAALRRRIEALSFFPAAADASTMRRQKEWNDAV